MLLVRRPSVPAFHYIRTTESKSRSLGRSVARTRRRPFSVRNASKIIAAGLTNANVYKTQKCENENLALIAHSTAIAPRWMRCKLDGKKKKKTMTMMEMMMTTTRMMMEMMMTTTTMIRMVNSTTTTMMMMMMMMTTMMSMMSMTTW